MADVTDAAFRRIIARESKISEREDIVLWTEFVSADGLFGGGWDKLSKDLIYTEDERPIVAQFFSQDGNLMKRAGKLAAEMNFDGVDINMGCPDKNICKQGSGAALIKTPEKAREIIRKTKEGAGKLPVSVKTRIGYSKIKTEEWLLELLKEEPAVVTLHARTKKEMSKVPAHWDEIRKAVQLRDKLGSKTLIVGNGDVVDIKDAREKAETTGADGIMLGRAIFGNPWLFREDIEPNQISLDEKLETLIEHSRLFEEILGDVKSFHIMKKHFKAYVSGFKNSKELRVKLMETENSKEIENEIRAFLDNTR